MDPNCKLSTLVLVLVRTAVSKCRTTLLNAGIGQNYAYFKYSGTVKLLKQVLLQCVCAWTRGLNYALTS